jgi:SET domain-containing protein
MATKDNAGFCIPYTIRVTPDKGRGVFSDAVILKGAAVWRHVPGQYAVYDERSFKELLGTLSQSEAVYELTHSFGLPEFPDYMIRVFDDGVLINHSSQPTVAMNNGSAAYDVPSVTSTHDVENALLDDRFALIAAQDLRVGDELTHDYNTDVEDPSYYDSLCEQYGVTWEWL